MRAGCWITATISDDVALRFLIALLGGPLTGWGIGFFIQKSIKVIAFIGGMFFFIIGVLYYIGQEAINTCTFFIQKSLQSRMI